MTSHFMSVLRQAFKTFDRANLASFNANLQHLKKLTDELTYRDLHIKEELFRDDVTSVDRAPCSYMHIFEDERFSMSLFIVRGNNSIPLHDHPMMYGLLRCIWGKLHVQSYTQQLPADEPLQYEPNPTLVNVVAEEPCLLTAETASALLTPRKRNYHQIAQAGNSIAAFFDILSPPYDANMPIHGPRRCRFYRPEPDGEQLQLQCIPSPNSYYCDLATTPDTVLQCGFVCAAEAYDANATAVK
ncbi:2-aminoethanethiol dioxygenase [Drosophila grimshawi]|uniref:GH15289 n=1 Tax=Drosophila grimshawi TaxID=7222 RepID=B4IWR4_DROGR|nr:2-aminoethanethiol dioxygenase [Drosophila grimshawi]EDV96290.1 GH15289 [Drosophila grimshawi]